MRINDTTQPGMNKLNDTSVKRKSPYDSSDSSSDSSVSQSSSGTDSVSLSDSAKDMAQMTGSLQDAPEVRTDLVASIRTRINDGTYDVSGRQIADKIVQSAIDDTF